MKLLFLDIDGVLNSNPSISHNYHKNGKSPICTENPAWRHVKWLDYIVEKTNTYIVISSTWRLHCVDAFLWDHLFYAIGARHIPGKIIGATPYLTGHRGTEIAQWLDDDFLKWKIQRGILEERSSAYKMNMNLESFIILDDSADMEPFMDRLVRTKTEIGLRRKEAELAIEMLNGGENARP